LQEHNPINTQLAHYLHGTFYIIFSNRHRRPWACY